MFCINVCHCHLRGSVDLTSELSRFTKVIKVNSLAIISTRVSISKENDKVSLLHTYI
jgi:hypothetical protein